MKKDLTELVFILDRSGSMGGLEKDTIGGYNSLLEKQKKISGEVKVSTVLFDDRYELLHNRSDITAVSKITDKDYFVRGSTALYDAVGKTIDDIGLALSSIHESQRPDKVLFVITTDGFENASREYSSEKVKQMISHQKSKYNWEFIFLGANIDAVKAAADIGIEAKKAVNFCSDSKGTQLNYEVLSEAVCDFRVNKKLKDNWQEEIEKDYMARKIKRVNL